jgi:SAM-dependent methyltransferase
MAEEFDTESTLFFSFYEGLRRKGPGSEASTRKALAMFDGLLLLFRIVDFGCGAGPASLVLAQATYGIVTAVDVYPPYLQELEAIAANEAMTERIRTVAADMADPPFPDGSFDLVWSEGAIYQMGFVEGLTRWRRLLRAGGFVAVTELSWLVKTPPRKAVEFWQTEYPAMSSIEDNQASLRAAGFEPVGHFTLPFEDWENYYGPLRDQLVVFRAEHSENSQAQAFADSMQQEIDIWNECSDYYGYVFYLGKAP